MPITLERVLDGGGLRTAQRNHERSPEDCLVADRTEILTARNTKKRRVLMVAAAFPPTGGPGVQRTAKFAKYLPQFGWLPTIWTMDRLEGFPEDPSLLDDLPSEVRIHRWNRGRSRRRFQKFFRRRASGTGLFSRIAKGIDWRLESRAAGKLWPDECVPWAKASERPLKRLIEEEQIDVIYSTFSPASNHLLALSLKEETGLPWIADFRDLWTKDFRYAKRSLRWRADDARLEQAVLSAADVVVGVSEKQTNILAEQGAGNHDKFLTITNGFDPADFKETTAPSSNERDWFVLAHVGRLDKSSVNDGWFEGLRRFVANLGGRRDSFHLRIVGHADKSTIEKLKQTGVWYAFTGYESHAQAVREMRSADALLLLVPDRTGADSIIRAKLFEYLASQHPILHSGPESGACVDIIRACQAGLCIGPDSQDVADSLQRMYKLWDNGKPMGGCSAQDAERYSRISLTRKLAGVLDGLVKTDGSPAKTDNCPVEVTV